MTGKKWIASILGWNPDLNPANQRPLSPRGFPRWSARTDANKTAVVQGERRYSDTVLGQCCWCLASAPAIAASAAATRYPACPPTRPRCLKGKSKRGRIDFFGLPRLASKQKNRCVPFSRRRDASPKN